MARKIYIGNLPYDMTEDEVRELFAQFGDVSSVNLISDRDTGRPRGFGFVEMPNDQDADAAMDALNGKEMGGRALTVNQARERADRGPPRRRV